VAEQSNAAVVKLEARARRTWAGATRPTSRLAGVVGDGRAGCSPPFRWTICRQSRPCVAAPKSRPDSRVAGDMTWQTTW